MLRGQNLSTLCTGYTSFINVEAVAFLALQCNSGVQCHYQYCELYLILESKMLHGNAQFQWFDQSKFYLVLSFFWFLVQRRSHDYGVTRKLERLETWRMRNDVERCQINLTVYITRNTPNCGLLCNDIGHQCWQLAFKVITILLWHSYCLIYTFPSLLYHHRSLLRVFSVSKEQKLTKSGFIYLQYIIFYVQKSALQLRHRLQKSARRSANTIIHVVQNYEKCDTTKVLFIA